MVTREIQTTTAVTLVDTPAARTATFQGATVDTVGCAAVDFAVFTTTVTTADASNYFTFSLEESEDGSAWSNVAIADVIIDGTPGDATGAAFVKVNSTATTDQVVTRMSYRGTMRYVRLEGTETGTASMVVGSFVVKGHLSTSPA